MIYQFYVFEIQKYANGEYGHIVHFAYDHSASLITSEGRLLMSQCYTHETQKQETEPATTE